MMMMKLGTEYVAQLRFVKVWNKFSYDDGGNDDNVDYQNDDDHLTSPFVSIWLNSSSANTADTNSDWW